MVVAFVAIWIAWTPNDTILNLVGNAWAGFWSSIQSTRSFLIVLERLNKSWRNQWYGCWGSHSYYLDCIH